MANKKKERTYENKDKAVSLSFIFFFSVILMKLYSLTVLVGHKR